MLDRSRTRLKDTEWTFTPDSNGNHSTAAATLACLMDIRDELKRLNSLLHCGNFLSIPRTLVAIKQNTTRRKRAKR